MSPRLTAILASAVTIGAIGIGILVITPDQHTYWIPDAGVSDGGQPDVPAGYLWCPSLGAAVPAHEECD